jgi:hypothetical protein
VKLNQKAVLLEFLKGDKHKVWLILSINKLNAFTVDDITILLLMSVKHADLASLLCPDLLEGQYCRARLLTLVHSNLKFETLSYSLITLVGCHKHLIV